MKLALFAACLLAAFFVDAANASCPLGWKLEKGSCYLFVDSLETFANAQKYCVAESAHLVTIKSDVENAYLQTLAAEYPPTEFWIGLKYETTVAEYRWIEDGSIAGFTDWVSGTPPSNLCAQMASTDSYKWSGATCVQLKRFICEKAEI